jgi:PhzF family phenazine biosynthesis protein
MARTIPIVQVDAFTDEPFRGNPAAVCLLREEATPEWMQAVAAEMNLSETAFVRRRAEGGFAIRWFTPTVEVPLCGHATLASAHAIWEEGLVSREQPITFHAHSGELAARREGHWICLNFPALPVQPADVPAGLAEALGCELRSVHRNRFGHYLVDADAAQIVRELRPDVAQLTNVGVGACIVTAPNQSGPSDFVSRVFVPEMGIAEDPVTGAAHCSLGPYWAERLGKTELVGHQVSKRGGIVRVRVLGDRVDLLGQGVTILRGELLA